MELEENENKDSVVKNEKEIRLDKKEEKNTFKRIKEMQQLIKKKSEMANHCMYIKLM